MQEGKFSIMGIIYTRFGNRYFMNDGKEVIKSDVGKYENFETRWTEKMIVQASPIGWRVKMYP